MKFGLVVCTNSLCCSRSLVEEIFGYQKVIQENRKLYNMAQDLKGEFGIEGVVQNG